MYEEIFSTSFKGFTISGQDNTNVNDMPIAQTRNLRHQVLEGHLI
jgi:hypothetical protein